MTSEKIYTYEEIQEIANFLKDICITPRLGIICGSGLGSLGETVENATKTAYKDIPNFPVSTVVGHEGTLIFGTISNVPVVCMQGRFHYYEGYSLSTCTVPVRLMKLLGVTHLILSNAAGGINDSFKVGNIMLIKDHINLLGMAGNNPLRGQNEERFGPRFPPMNGAYDPELIELFKETARESNELSIKEGVYAMCGGPNYETTAELKMLKCVGADAVGMSTVHEVIVAKHCGLVCLGFSLITNLCKTSYDEAEIPDCQEVLDVGKKSEETLKKLLVKFIGNLGQKLESSK